MANIASTVPFRSIGTTLLGSETPDWSIVYRTFSPHDMEASRGLLRFNEDLVGLIVFKDLPAVGIVLDTSQLVDGRDHSIIEGLLSWSVGSDSGLPVCYAFAVKGVLFKDEIC